MQLCIENVDQAGGCAYGYACVYTDTISWASPTEPLPMIRDPRVAFDQLFGVGATPAERARAAAPTQSILDWVAGRVSRLRARRSARPIARGSTSTSTTSARSSAASSAIEAHNASGEPRELPGAPIGVPDSFDEHVKLMFDLQALAFAGGHHARVLVQDGPRRLGRASIRRAASRGRSTRRRTTASARSASLEFAQDQQATTSACCRTSSTS